MAGLDPVASSGASANIAAIVDAELAALAADAAALKALLSIGDVVQAQVLPSNGLTDLIQILGNRVAAALPPNLTPGDVVAVQVTGFDGDRINVQIVSDSVASAASSTPPAIGASAPSSVDPALPLPATALPPTLLPATPPPVAPLPVTPLPAIPSSSGAPAVTPAPIFAPGSSAIAPPLAVFVAASVRPAPAAPAAPSEPLPVEPTATIPASVRAAIPAPVLLGDIEARLATARAAVIPQNVAPPPASSPGAPIAAPPAGAIPPATINRPFVMAPLMTNARPATVTAPVITPAATTAPANAAPLARLTTYQDPVILLRALRLPVTPTNVASARMAIDTPAKLPNALATLELALPSSTDPRITTLRTLTAFVGRIEPESPVLATQIAAFVDHVVAGAEPKLAQLLVALRSATAEPVPAETPAPGTTVLGTPAPGTATPGTPAPGTTAPGTTASQAAPPPAPLPGAPVTVLARAVERQATLDFDLKTQLLSIVTSPPPGASEALTNAVAGVLTAMTALQVNAASTLSANPNGFAFILPVALPSGIAQANVRIDRDVPGNPRVPFDGDNFHIAFILETAHLGTVAIDLKTVGRSVTIDVKAEATLAARAFGKSMEQLTTRLEKLRYRVAKADASVAARGTMGVVSTTIGPEAPPTSPVDPTKLVDRSA